MFPFSPTNPSKLEFGMKHLGGGVAYGVQAEAEGTEIKGTVASDPASCYSNPHTGFSTLLSYIGFLQRNYKG